MAKACKVKSAGDNASVQQPRQWLLVLINYGIRVATWLTLGLCFRIKRLGRKNLPRRGGVLVISNHVSLSDPPLLNIALRRIPHWLAMAELFKSKFAHWLSINAGLIPIDRNAPGSAPMKEAIRLLRAGHVLVIFPEGGIREGENSVLGGNPDIKEGAALIAMRAGVPIMPVIIDGARQTYERRNWFFRRCTIRLTFGEPFTLNGATDRATIHKLMRDQLLALAAEVKGETNPTSYVTEANRPT